MIRSPAAIPPPPWAALLVSLAFAAPSTLAGSPTVARGKELYLASCARCHGEDGTGGGPDAAALEARPVDFRRSRLLESHTDEELVQRIRGERLALGALPSMPPNAPDTDALYRFLVRIPSVRWPVADRGRGLYLPRCSDCHGRYGHGDGLALDESGPRPRDLSDPAFQKSVGDAELRILVRHAKPGMLPLDPTVSGDQSLELASFVRLLSPGYELYFRYCVSCHGQHGEAGGRGSRGRQRLAFDRRYFAANPYPDQVKQRIWHMLSGARPAMPHFEATLGPDEVKAILAYLRSLPPLP